MSNTLGKNRPREIARRGRLQPKGVSGVPRSYHNAFGHFKRHGQACGGVFAFGGVMDWIGYPLTNRTALVPSVQSGEEGQVGRDRVGKEGLKISRSALGYIITPFFLDCPVLLFPSCHAFRASFARRGPGPTQYFLLCHLSTVRRIVRPTAGSTLSGTRGLTQRFLSCTSEACATNHWSLDVRAHPFTIGAVPGHLRHGAETPDRA